MRWLFCGIALVIFVSCQRDSRVDFIPKGPHPLSFPDMEYPEGNPFSEESVVFGRTLFFDVRFSANNDVSCATCHQPEHYFADDAATTSGTGGAPGTRNVPSLVNVGFHPYFTREGGVATLEQQVLIPIQEHNEFNSNILLIVDELNEDPELVAMSQAAYEDSITSFTLTRGLAAYQRSLISGYTRFDHFEEGLPSALTVEEREGLDLFFGAAGCSTCHGGFDFTTYEVVNNGLYAYYEDPGLYRLTLDPADSGKFKVPSLRNIARTAPYMHDGSIFTLEEVLDHYLAGGSGHSNQDSRIQPLDLDNHQQQAIIAFLKTLTDEAFITNHNE